MLHFSKYGESPCIRAKQVNRGILISVKDNTLRFELGKTVFGIKGTDRFQNDEVNAVLSYLVESKLIDAKAVDTLLKEGKRQIIE